jgi:hypothetical protein
MTGPIKQLSSQTGLGRQSGEHLMPSGDGWQCHASPVCLGYLLGYLLPACELIETRDRLKRLALVEGFAIGAIYVEHQETKPAAFEALVDAISRYDVKAVVIPSCLPLVDLAATNNIKDAFERATGARIITANPYP